MMSIFNRKNFKGGLSVFVFFLIFLGSFLFLPILPVQATGCSISDIRGYAWSDNVGWVSFSCMNEYEVGEGFDYGVNFNRDTGVLSGHAWNDDVGWISFNESDLNVESCPDSPGDCTAKIEDGTLTGWATGLSNNEWISLSGTAGDGTEYGGTVVVPEIYGYSWGGETIGWMSYNCADEGVCDASDYKVRIDLTRLNVRTDNVLVVYDEDTDVANVTFKGRLLGIASDPEVDVWFEWGEDGDNLNNTTSKETVTEDGSFSIEEVFNNPVLGDTYYFRAVAESSTEITYGTVESFSLLTCNPTNIRGYAWSDNVGWISFSCMDEYNVGEGVDYGVSFEPETEVLFGYAWNDNIGWISFNESDLNVESCPDYPGDCTAKIEDGTLTGWAVVLDEDEWISLSGITGDGGEYGVDLIIPQFYGYAFGDTVLGWISFNCADEGICNTSNYKVYTSLFKLFARTNPANVDYDGDLERATITLNGTLLEMGDDSAADVWFEWGDDPNLADPETTTVQEMQTTGSFASQIVMENATIGDTYYFRAMAESTSRESQGSILSFEISQSEGDIIIRYKGVERAIEINKEGVIEIKAD